MTFSIGHRLFVGVLLAALTVATVAIELLRWRSFDNFADSVEHPDSDAVFVDALREALRAQYRARHDWSFVPTEPTKRKQWLHDAVANSRTFGERVAVLDARHQVLAGVTASWPLKALASIDTVERPVDVEGVTVGFVVLAKPANPEDQLAVAFLLQQQARLAVVALATLLLTAVVAAVLATHFRKPIAVLVAAARRLEHAQFDTRVTLGRSDELGELAETFNHLAARLEAAERARQQWVADTSHELRTPLAVLRGHLEALQDGVREATPEHSAMMLRHVGALTKLVDDLSEMARADVGALTYEKKPHDVWAALHDVVHAFDEKIRAAGLVATVGPSPSRTVVACDLDRVRQVFVNLLENGVRYTNSGGRIEIVGAALDDGLRLTFDDSAPAVPPEALARLGERFYRVDASRSRASGGSGLGLAVSRHIVETHGGRLAFEPSPLGGLRVTVCLNWS